MELGKWIDAVREQRPLVHNITNVVVNQIVANGLLASGASPVMAYAHEEVADMARIAKALALNMGTLNPDVVESMRIAGNAANEAHIPVIFDPVGVGATPYRNQTAAQIANELALTVLRGNSGEMSVFLGLDATVQGVDSVSSSLLLPSAMKDYAQRTGTVLVATGPIDYVTDGQYIFTLQNGHALLSTITGSGCLLTAVIAAFLGVVKPSTEFSSYMEATIAAITFYNVAAEKAAKQTEGPGTFYVHLFDALYTTTAQEIEQFAKVACES